MPERHYLGIKKELVKALDLVNWYEGENHIILYIIDIKHYLFLLSCLYQQMYQQKYKVTCEINYTAFLCLGIKSISKPI